jgi:5-methylcytosine-specific restriction protein A
MNCQLRVLVWWVWIWVSGTLRRVSTKRRLRGSDRPYRFNPVTKRPLCRWCGKDVAPPKRTFCGPACVHEFLLRSDPRYLRQKVFERDRGVCVECKLDTVQLQRELSDLPFGDERDARKLALGFPAHRDTFWDADHVVPVVEGGGECDLSNMATLCCRCHFAKKRQAA